MSAFKKLLALFKPALTTDPVALAVAKRAMEKRLRQDGASNKEAKTLVAEHFKRS